MSFDSDHIIHKHTMLLEHAAEDPVSQRLTSSPLLMTSALRLAQQQPAPVRQYGLLGRVMETSGEGLKLPASVHSPDRRLFFNMATPSSTFICGSQGSGKSHTLSCLLENCLTGSDAAVLPRPLTSLLFHYDTFISDDGGSPCEAAFLGSLRGIRVRVLCSPTNIATIRVSLTHFSLNRLCG